MTASGWLVLLVVVLVCLEAGRLIRKLCRNLPTGQNPEDQDWAERKEAARKLHATSDFGNILMDQANKALRRHYDDELVAATPPAGHWPPIPDPLPPPPTPPCYWDAPEPWTRARSPKTACARHGGSPWDCPLPLEVVTTG